MLLLVPRNVFLQRTGYSCLLGTSRCVTTYALVYT